MAATIEIAYYNSFVLSGGESAGEWHVEESRMKGGFNEKSVDLGVRAYMVDDKYAVRTRPNAMIYSGVFNSKTNLNNTNQFNISKNITRSVDIQNGSIQKLYAEDTDLIIFQENKVSKALIDKDAIYTAEGQAMTTSGARVIGQVTAFAGKYGISKNPESFAVYGNRKYFSDKNRGVILRLSQDGLTPISNYGMRAFFRKYLNIAQRIYGMYDEQKNNYVVSIQKTGSRGLAKIYTSYKNTFGIANQPSCNTLSFDESVGGWVSFYTYKPTFGFSQNNNFYTFNNKDLWKHYTLGRRGHFYRSMHADPSIIKLIFNDEPNIIKNFLTIGYEGSKGWAMPNARTDMQWSWGITEGSSGSAIPVNFINKENKYYSHLRKRGGEGVGIVSGIEQAGIKGYINTVELQFHNKSGEKAELFSVFSEVNPSS